MKTKILVLATIALLSGQTMASSGTIQCWTNQFPNSNGSRLIIHINNNELDGFITLQLNGVTDPLKKTWASYTPGKPVVLPHSGTVNYLTWAGGWPDSPRLVALHNLYFNGNSIQKVMLGIIQRKYNGNIWYNNETVYTYQCGPAI